MNLLIFLGSTRESQPPEPKRVGQRVATYLQNLIVDHGHDVAVIDPLDINFPPIFKPHFSFKKEEVPADLEELSQKIKKAEGYIALSPEYNHSMSPALSHLLNHFGSTSYSYKPSLIATYSQGQWGGARAAVTMRTFLGELGCLPVSSMIHVPRAHQIFNEKGELADAEDKAQWDSYLGRSLAQLYWWADACRAQKKIQDPGKWIKNFKKCPEQRNAPS